MTTDRCDRFCRPDGSGRVDGIIAVKSHAMVGFRTRGAAEFARLLGGLNPELVDLKCARAEDFEFRPEVGFLVFSIEAQDVAPVAQPSARDVTSFFQFSRS